MLVIQEFMDELDFKNLYIAGNVFEDSIAGLSLAAKTNSPVMLFYDTLHERACRLLKLVGAQVLNLTVLGGEAALRDEVLKGIMQYINNGGEFQGAGITGSSIIADGHKVNITLSWDDASDEERVEGEVLTFKLKADLKDEALPVDNIAYIMVWTKDGGPAGKDDVEITCSEDIIAGVQGFPGAYRIGASHLISGHESYTIKIVFNNSGIYRLQAFAVTE